MTRVQRVKGPEQSERAIRNEGGFGDHSVGRPLRPAKSVWQCAYADLPAARADCQRLPGQWHRCDHFQVARRVMLQSRRGARGPGRTRLSQSLGRGPGRRATVLVCAGESTWLSPACDPPVELAKRANAKDGGSSVQMPCFDAPRIHESTRAGSAAGVQWPGRLARTASQSIASGRGSAPGVAAASRRSSTIRAAVSGCVARNSGSPPASRACSRSKKAGSAAGGRPARASSSTPSRSAARSWSRP